MKTKEIKSKFRSMRTLVILLITVFAIGVFTPVNAQTTDKEATKALNKKAMKKARKDAKKRKKDGYYVPPGALPMEIQLENSWTKQMKMDEDGHPVYLTEPGNSVAETQTAAKLQATETAKLNLAGKISTNVAALIESNLANQQLNDEEAASVTKTVAAAKNVIAQELGRVIPLFEAYKKVGKSNVQCDIILAYPWDTAYDVAKKTIRKSLEEETDIMQEKLDKLMDF